MAQSKYNSTFNEGSIEVIIGTMYSGKSRELLHRAQRAKKFGNLDVFFFKPIVDTRDGEFIKSRDGLKEPVCLFSKSIELLVHLENKKGLVIIDEAQFSDEDIVPVAQLLKFKGNNLIFSGLPNDFRGQPFGQMPHLMALSDVPIKTIYSVCSVDGCLDDGVLAQRLRNGEPDSALSPTVIIENSQGNDKIEYEPRCDKHHQVPDIEEYLLKSMENPVDRYSIHL